MHAQSPIEAAAWSERYMQVAPRPADLVCCGVTGRWLPLGNFFFLGQPPRGWCCVAGLAMFDQKKSLEATTPIATAFIQTRHRKMRS
jgi:hypothetical protein